MNVPGDATRNQRIMSRAPTATVVETTWGFCALGALDAGLWSSSLPEKTPERALEAAQLAGAQTPAGRFVVSANASGTPRAAILREAAEFLQAYFEGGPSLPQIALAIQDQPPFTRRVLQACVRIGSGEVATYGQLAAAAGAPGAARAVGQAMARNRLPIFVPCHRVIGGGGELTGFAGGLELKARLLSFEGRKVNQHATGKWFVVD